MADILTVTFEIRGFRDLSVVAGSQVFVRRTLWGVGRLHFHKISKKQVRGPVQYV